jgi:esterase/lipase superfamily enzyme
VKALNIIAHSKGNQLVLDALDQMASAQGAPRGTHLVLASPDVDVDVAEARLANVPKIFDSVTLYANAFDRPLWASGGKARRIRAGSLLSDGCPLVVPDVFSIDSNKADFELLGLNHDAYMDAPPLLYDIGALFRYGVTNPNKRTSTLLPTKNPRGLVYYRLADGVRTG